MSDNHWRLLLLVLTMAMLHFVLPNNKTDYRFVRILLGFLMIFLLVNLWLNI